MSTASAHAPAPLSPPGRSKRILVNVFILHVLVVAFPLGWVMLMDQFDTPEETFSINIVDTPSVGPVTGPVTTRRAPSDNPGPEPVAPLPDTAPPPPPVAEPVVTLPDAPKPQPVAEPTVALPSPRPAARPEPKITLPKVPVQAKPAAQTGKNTPKNTAASDDRRLTNQKKPGGGGGSNTNSDVPIGKEDVAQKFGEKFSNTAQGGPDKATRYAGILGMFLKTQWQIYVPSRADLGSGNPTVKIMLSVSGSGQVLEAKIIRPSGVPAMDLAAARLLSELKRVPAPLDGKPWKHDNIELETEM